MRRSPRVSAWAPGDRTTSVCETIICGIMIETEGLTKEYGPLRAVDDLSFRCEPGEVLGFLGPNGAGKSTTMKMITGFVSPTSGTASVCGHDIVAEPLAAKRSLGYLPEGAPSYPEMTPLGFLEFVADMRRLEGAERQTRLDEMIGQLHLEPVLHQTIDTLSKGYRRRVGLAQALLHDPPVLILDEPTDGLDPNQKHEVRALIRSMASEKLIVISTHILEEVEAVCSRAIIIAHGRILADETPAALAARSRYHNAVRLTLADGESLETVSEALGALAEVAETEIDPMQRSVTALPRNGVSPFAAVTELVRARRWELAALELESGRLDQVFRDITTAGSAAGRTGDPGRAPGDSGDDDDTAAADLSDAAAGGSGAAAVGGQANPPPADRGGAV